jgi:AcrR family transcriptional regulator
MTFTTTTASRRRAVSDLKRTLILDAARAVFESEGLEGASLRGIAAKAGYTPAALYFHFDSKEAIYAEVLAASLERLNTAVASAVSKAKTPQLRFEAAALAWFEFYIENPSDLDLGFYLFRARLKPQGLGRERDANLNAALEQSLAPLTVAACELGADKSTAREIMAGVFAHATGVLTLAHTGRIRTLKANPRAMMAHHIASQLSALKKRP